MFGRTMSALLLLLDLFELDCLKRERTIKRKSSSFTKNDYYAWTKVWFIHTAALRTDYTTIFPKSSLA